MNSKFEKFLEIALGKRKSLFSEREGGTTTAFRLFLGKGEGIEGLVVDIYDHLVLLQVYEGRCALSSEVMKDIAQWYRTRLKLDSVYLKPFMKDRSKLTLPPPCLLLTGVPSPSKFIVSENGIKYSIMPTEGFSTGLFLDQRENRKHLAEKSAGKRVLNLFSYTCSFSVVCAKSGASVTSVDISKKALTWGKENFALNGISPLGHWFVAQDVRDYLLFAKKKGFVFDLIILDPPSFARNARGKAFSVSRDWRELVEAALTILSKEGTLFFSTNLEGFEGRNLRDQLDKGPKNFKVKGARKKSVETNPGYFIS